MVKGKGLVLLILFGTLAGPAHAQRPAGEVAFLKIADAAFDPYINNPQTSQQQWMLAHYARMLTYAPRFDRELAWYSDAWFYKDAYAVYPQSQELSEHPEWVLRDANGNMLYIPFACSNGSCPQYAGDFGNPAFRAHWTAQAQATLAAGYRGIWIDDVNMTWRVGDGFGNHVVPIDPRTGSEMTLDDWRRYLAEFMETVRAALPDAEIVHNIVWYSGDRDNSDPFIIRQVEAANFINLERGVTDLGLTGGSGRFALTTFLEFVDFLHGRGLDVILKDEATTLTQRQYALAGWFAINSGSDIMSSENASWTTPDGWWEGYDLNLGEALGPRYSWQNLIRRDFSCGMILLNPPDRAVVSVQLGDTYTTIDGAHVSSGALAGDESMILLADCANNPPDGDGDGIADDADNCVLRANPGQRDSNNDGYGNACDADLNDDCAVNTLDLGLMRTRFFSADPHADLDGDGNVSAADLGLLRRLFFAPPGPSALTSTCAGN